VPDIREISLLMPGEPGRFRWGKMLSRAKMAVRWAVVATARTPLRFFYGWVYRAHVWYAVRVAKRFPGTRAIYVARSVAKGEIVFGVSDIDIVIVGEWPEDEQIRLMRKLGLLSALSPLYDSGLWQQVHTRESLHNLWATDYFFQSRFDEGRRQWKLEYGSDLVATLGQVPTERKAGGYYMEARSWWLHFIASTFGSGPTAQDAIFRNSIAYKTVVEVLNIARAVRTGRASEESRSAALRRSFDETENQDRDFLSRLEESAAVGHLRFRGDIQRESLKLLLPVLDRIHADLGGLPSFAPLGQFQVDAHADELLRTPQAIAHGRRLAEHAKQTWPSFRGAYLAPSAACFAMDDLLLLIEPDPLQLPEVAQLRALCALHEQSRAQVPQRIALCLLLPAGACQLEFVNFTEMWRVLIFPSSTPDLFTLIRRPEFLIDGESPKTFGLPVWSRFARDIAVEELNVRRSVLSRVTPDVFPSSIEILRNVWRHLQLEVLVRTSARGPAIFALSLAAVRRELQALALADEALLQALEDAYRHELGGNASDVRSLMDRIMVYLTGFREPDDA
jgi:predicted nucleotidyltransferase